MQRIMEQPELLPSPVLPFQTSIEKQKGMKLILQFIVEKLHPNLGPSEVTKVLRIGGGQLIRSRVVLQRFVRTSSHLHDQSEIVQRGWIVRQLIDRDFEFGRRVEEVVLVIMHQPQIIVGDAVFTIDRNRLFKATLRFGKMILFDILDPLGHQRVGRRLPLGDVDRHHFLVSLLDQPAAATSQDQAKADPRMGPMNS